MIDFFLLIHVVSSYPIHFFNNVIRTFKTSKALRKGSLMLKNFRSSRGSNLMCRVHSQGPYTGTKGLFMISAGSNPFKLVGVLVIFQIR